MQCAPGASFDAEQVTDSERDWKRLVSEGAPSLALSGGLLESARGKPKEGRGWLNRLVRVGTGETTSAQTGVWPVTAALTPYLVADELVRDGTREAEQDAERLADRAAFRVGKALGECAPVLHEQRRVEHEVMVALGAGRVLGVESKGDRPDPKTLACFKEKVAALALSPNLSQLAIRWAHEGPKASWEVAQEDVSRGLALVQAYLCADDTKLLDGFVKAKASAALVFESGVLTSISIGGERAPEKFSTCLKDKFEATPVSVQDRLEVTVPFAK